MSNVKSGRMHLYVWSYKNEPTICKLGDRFVFDGQNPTIECEKRIRESLGVNKSHFDDGLIIIHLIVDVGDYAAAVGRNYIHAKMDDYVRNIIGHRHGTTGDKHDLNGDEMAIRLLDHLVKVKQPLKRVGLAVWQHDTLKATIADINAGKKTIVLELCARAGKTIFTGALLRETNTQLTIVASYVLTCFPSFYKDLRAFEQFRDVVIVDTADKNYKIDIDAALKAGKQVVAFISMFGKSQRQSRIDYLFDKKVTRALVVDEADFGAWQPGQAIPLMDARKTDDVVILMTGTNADKAAALWPSVAYHSLTYPELLMIKGDKKKAYNSQLQHFQIDVSRHEMVAKVEFYQADLTAVVNLALKAEPDMFKNGTDNLPSWSKAAKDVNKAAGFWTRMFEATLLGKHSILSLNMRVQLNLKNDPRNSMWFVPGSMKNEEFAKLERIARDALNGWDVVAIYGDRTSNRKAEQMVKEAVEKAAKCKRSLLILSKGMAQRSFSISEIIELYLAYDGGDTGATIQRLSRALTPAKGKIAKVISLSFNPDRDDKFDAVLIQTAKNLATKNKTTIPVELRKILPTVDLFRCKDDGRFNVKADEYMKQLIENDRLGHLIASKADIKNLTAEEIKAIAEGDVEAFKTASAAKTKVGKTYADNATRAAAAARANKDLRVKALKVMATVANNSHLMINATGANSIDGMIQLMDANTGYQSRVAQIFDLEWGIIKTLFDRGCMPRDLLELTLTA